MRFSLSSNWHANRVSSGEALVDTALELGFDALELGYNTTEEHVPGIRARIAQGAISVDSVHAYCPVPLGASHGYPELHLLASENEDERALASMLLGKTRDFAQSVGAKAVVLHAGRVFLRSFWGGDLSSDRLLKTATSFGSIDDPHYQKRLRRAKALRVKRGESRLVSFKQTLEKVLPLFESAGLLLCLENLPSIEGFPNEEEMALLAADFSGSPLRYWHDMGHGALRALLAWSTDDHEKTVASLLPSVAGIHIHDAAPPFQDHLAPGEGNTDFSAFRMLAAPEILKVFEPSPSVGKVALQHSLSFLRSLWSEPLSERKS